MIKNSVIYFLLSATPSLFSTELSVSQLNRLSFGKAVQGDPPLSIDPGLGEREKNASFLVQGDPNRTYTIVLPSNGAYLEQGAGYRIRVDQFKSFPVAGNNGKLDANGRQVFFVGATREGVNFNHPRGHYRGSFLVTVLY